MNRMLGWALVFACGSLIAINIALARKSREMQAEVDGYRRLLSPNRGMRVPLIGGLDIQGKRKIVVFGKDPRKTVLLVMTPFCGACDENWPKWKRLIELADRRHLRILVIDLSSQLTPEYIDKHRLDVLDVMTGVDAEVIISLRLRFVPQTVILSATGEVENIWTGVLSQENLQKILAPAQENATKTGI